MAMYTSAVTSYERPLVARHGSYQTQEGQNGSNAPYEQSIVKAVCEAAPGTSLQQQTVNLSIPVGPATFKYKGTMLPTALLVSLQSTVYVGSLMPLITLGGMNGSLSGRGVFNSFDVHGLVVGCTRLYRQGGWIMFKADVCVWGQSFNVDQRAYPLPQGFALHQNGRPPLPTRKSLL